MRIGDNLLLQNQVTMANTSREKFNFRTKQFTDLSDSQWQDIAIFFEDQRKRKYSLRKIFDAIRYVTRTGCQWRNLDKSYPAWQIVYYYFCKWKETGKIEAALTYLVEKERISQGRNGKATACAIDSQSVKKGALVSLDCGIDGGKQTNGRKRHIVVDTLGLPLAIYVSAANVHDSIAAIELLPLLNKTSKDLKLMRADKAYRGDFEMWAKYCKITVEISQKPPTEKGFVPQTGRWQVERSFAWLNNFRRLSKDYEKTTGSSAAFIQIAYSDIILARKTITEI